MIAAIIKQTKLTKKNFLQIFTVNQVIIKTCQV